MFNAALLNRRYISYTVYSVTRLKNKYGFRVKLFLMMKLK